MKNRAEARLTKDDNKLNPDIMIFNFRLVSDEVDNFRREINIDADATFLDLRNAICDSVGYDKNQMCSFFLCDNNWEKGKEITLEDMGSDSDEDIYLMDETVLSDFVDDGQRLIFVFDYMTDRWFLHRDEEKYSRQELEGSRMCGFHGYCSRSDDGYR